MMCNIWLIKNLTMIALLAIPVLMLLVVILSVGYLYITFTDTSNGIPDVIPAYHMYRVDLSNINR